MDYTCSSYSKPMIASVDEPTSLVIDAPDIYSDSKNYKYTLRPWIE